MAEARRGTTVSSRPSTRCTIPIEVRDMYDRWAASYDTELIDENGYAQPRRCAEMLSRYLTDRNAEILDIGCGTGLSGAALAEAGYGVIDGCDFSAGMLEKARATGLYRRLFGADLNAPPLDAADGAYAAAVAVGVFGFGHIQPACLDEILRIVSPGAPLVIGLNEHFYEDGALTAKLDALAADGPDRPAGRGAWRPYPGHRRDRLGHRRAEDGRLRLNEKHHRNPLGSSAKQVPSKSPLPLGIPLRKGRWPANCLLYVSPDGAACPGATIRGPESQAEGFTGWLWSPDRPCGPSGVARMEARGIVLAAGPVFNNISFFSILFLDTADPAPYIGPVNARSAPAAAGRRPSRKKKQTKKPAGTVRDRSVLPALRPAAAVGHPIRYSMRHWA